MRVISKKFVSVALFVFVISTLFSSLFAPNLSYALKKPAGAGDWFTTDPSFVNGQIKIGNEVFTSASCPNGWNSTGDACKACFDQMAPAGSTFRGSCPFDPTTEHKRAMFVSQNRLPDNAGGSYLWGVWVEYASSDLNSDVTKGATLIKIMGTGVNATVGGRWAVTIANPGDAPGPTLPSDPNRALYFKEPIILGKFTMQGKVVPNIGFKIVKINPDGTEGDQIPATSGNNYTGTTILDAVKSPVPIADSDGQFVTVTSSGGLPNGTYKIIVDQVANEEYLNKFKEAASKWGVAARDCSFFGLLGVITCKELNDLKSIPEDMIKKITAKQLHIMGTKTVTISGGKSAIDVVVPLEMVEISETDKALSSAIKAMAGFVESALKFFMGWNYNLLVVTPNYVLSSGTEGAWLKIRNIALTLLVLALLIIAFANVIGVDIETYGLNRMIPRIIIAIIFCYASWVIVTFFFDFTEAIQAQAVGLIGGKFGLDTFDTFHMTIPSAGQILGKIGVVLLFLALLFVVLICSIILWFSLLLRVVYLAFLLAVAPIAFIFSIMPFTETLYKRWWSEFWKWMFMGPVAVAIIALGYIIASGFSGSANLGGTVDYSAVQSTDANSNMIIGLIIFGASLVVAAQLPLQWGGKVMGGWRNKVGKQFGGWLANKATRGYVKDMWERRKANVEGLKRQRHDRFAGKIANALGDNSAASRVFLGTNKAGAMGMKNAAKESFKKENANATMEDLQAQAGKYKNNPMAMQALSEIAQEKWGGAEKLFARPGELNEFGAYIGTAASGNPAGEARQLEIKKQAAAALAPHMADAGFREMMMDKNQNMVVHMAEQMGGTTGNNLLKAVVAKNAGKKPDQVDAGLIKGLTETYGGIGHEDANKLISQLGEENVKSIAKGPQKLKGNWKDLLKTASDNGTLTTLRPQAASQWDAQVANGNLEAYRSAPAPAAPVGDAHFPDGGTRFDG